MTTKALDWDATSMPPVTVEMLLELLPTFAASIRRDAAQVVKTQYGKHLAASLTGTADAIDMLLARVAGTDRQPPQTENEANG